MMLIVMRPKFLELLLVSAIGRAEIMVYIMISAAMVPSCQMV